MLASLNLRRSGFQKDGISFPSAGRPCGRPVTIAFERANTAFIRMESTEPPAQALHDADGSRQGGEKDHDGSRTRAVGLHLGHRDQRRSVVQTTTGGMRGTERTKAKTFQIRKKQKRFNQ